MYVPGPGSNPSHSSGNAKSLIPGLQGTPARVFFVNMGANGASNAVSSLGSSLCPRMYDSMSTMVCVKEDKLEKLTQDEIISKTKQVIQGLEALKNEHNSILQSLLETLKCLKKDDESNLVEEKSNMIRKSLEMLELGLSEAQVRLSLDGPASLETRRPPLKCEGGPHGGGCRESDGDGLTRGLCA